MMEVDSSEEGTQARKQAAPDAHTGSVPLWRLSGPGPLF